MRYARIDLSKTNYQLMHHTKLLSGVRVDLESMQRIYKEYCQYKKFKSVMPIFDSEFKDASNRIHAYYDPDNLKSLIAFSLIRVYDSENVEAIQFAWDYKQPELQLGIESLKHECAFYKAFGFKYYYLGGADEYKKQIDGFEILGPA